MTAPSFAEGIEYIEFSNIPTYPFFNYELQEKAAIAVCEDSFKNGKTNLVMCFGQPGTGKSIFPHHIAQKLQKYKPNLLIISCNTLLSKYSGTASVIAVLNNTITKAENNRPLIYVLDEIDAITQQRLLSTRRQNVNEFTQWFMDTLGNDFSNTIKREGKMAVFAFTNDIVNVDGAVRRRFDNTFHFELPSDEVLLSMLEHYKIEEKSQILPRFKEILLNSKIDGASFMRACKNCHEEILQKKLSPGEAARKLAANIGPNLITEELEKIYTDNLAPFINVANEAMRDWGEKKFEN